MSKPAAEKEATGTARAGRRDEAILQEIVRRLVEVYHPERIYLFGSTARGDAGPDSDFDLMVIVPDEATEDRRDPGRGYRALWGVRTAADVLVWPHSEFYDRLPLKASLPSTVLREGRLLYEG